MIRIGRVCNGGKVHMHIGERGHGGRNRTRIIQTISTDMLQWIRPQDLCKVCFSAKRLALVSSLNAFSNHSWDHNLDMFLSRIPARRPVDTTPANRIEEMRREILARFQSEGIVR